MGKPSKIMFSQPVATRAGSPVRIYDIFDSRYLKIEKQRLIYIYKWAKTRCNNPNTKQWHNYGGRGIKFLFSSFEEFLNELGPRPLNYSLDRIDNNGNYEIGNVRWASRKDQNNNKGPYKNSSTGITGISVIHPKGKYKTTRYQTRVYIKNKRVELYKGPSLEKAILIMKDYNETQN